MADRLIPVVLLCVVAFHLILAWVWIRVDVASPYWDEAGYLYHGTVQLDALRSGGVAGWYRTWLSLDRIRPDLVSALTIPFFAIFGVTNDAGLLVNLLALGLLLIATYGLGSAIHGRRAGLLAAVIIGGYPMLIGLSHTLMMELTMTALVAATLCCLWRSNGFSDVRWMLAAGLVTGLGFLTKVFFVVFVAGPWLTVTLHAFRREDGRWAPPPPAHLRNLLLCVLLSAAIAASWYVPNFVPMVRRSVGAAVGAEAALYGPANPLHPRNLLRHLLRFIGTDTSATGFLAFLLGIAGLIVVERRSRQEPGPRCSSVRHSVTFLASSALVGYLVFTSLRNQGMHHLVGILPAMAVLSGGGITELAGHRWIAATAAAAMLMVAQATLSSFPGPLQDTHLSVSVVGEELLLLHPARRWGPATYLAPSRESWPTHEILTYALLVSDLETLPHDRARVGVIPDHECMEPVAFVFEAYRSRMPVVISRAQADNLQDLDVLLHKTGDLGWAWKERIPSIEPALKKLSEPDYGFELMPRTFALPDGSEAMIYGRKPSPLLANRPSPTYPRRSEFGNSARFLGYDIAVEQGPRSTQTVAIAYYWESLGPTRGDYKVFIHFMDPETGNIAFQDDHVLFSRTYPTGLWQLGRFLADRRTVQVPPAYSSPSAMLRIGLYNENGRLPVTSPSEKGAASATYADLGIAELMP